MKIRWSVLTLVAILCMMVQANAQQALEQNKRYTGAQAAQPVYRAIYQLDQASPDIIRKAIRNINNLLEDPRLKGKIQVEMVAFSGGTEAYRKNSEYEAAIRDLAGKGVVVAQCLNTMKERNIAKSELYDFIAYVPSGNGELVIRGADGWVIVKP